LIGRDPVRAAWRLSGGFVALGGVEVAGRLADVLAEDRLGVLCGVRRSGGAQSEVVSPLVTWTLTASTKRAA
jgi:hypothetical protein